MDSYIINILICNNSINKSIISEKMEPLVLYWNIINNIFLLKLLKEYYRILFRVTDMVFTQYWWIIAMHYY